MKKVITTITILFSLISGLLSVLAHPKAGQIIDGSNNEISQKFGFKENRISLPQEILVFMVEFENLRFEDSIDHQDFLSGDFTIKDFIERHFFHLKSYYQDASYGQYNPNFTVYENIIRTNETMEYYGDFTQTVRKRVYLTRDIIEAADPYVNFSLYDAFVIMHSGAGRETDIYGNNPNSIWSTFLSYNSFKNVLDPNNEDFKGIPTSDGTFISEIVIVPSHQRHPDFSGSENFGVLGIKAQLFGRQMGLPTLFDNVPSQGGSTAGIGNFGIMGTGVWNANGFVPPLPSAWTRVFAGWYKPFLIEGSESNFTISHALDYEGNYPRIYRINITETEYFLIENRQQNPSSTFINGQPSFSFKLLDEGQDFYPPPFDDVPRFNFMKNSYRGCEWDFYLPGLGGPDTENLIDGSGLLIWHIDDEIITEKFNTNTINGNPEHRGVALKEADGIAHLASPQPHIYGRGSPYDAFRYSNNDYLGNLFDHDGLLSLPTSEGHYGKNEIEIFNISASGNLMYFSVSRPAEMNTGYKGKTSYPISFFSDNKIFHPMDNGEIYIWENYEVIKQDKIEPISKLYAYDPSAEAFIIPTFNDATGILYKYTLSKKETLYKFDDLIWASHPMVVEYQDNTFYIAFLNSQQDTGCRVVVFDQSNNFFEYDFADYSILANPVYYNNRLYIVVSDGQNENNKIFFTDFTNHLSALSFESLNLFINDSIDYFFQVPLDYQVSPEAFETSSSFLLITENNYLYLVNSNFNLLPGFPVRLPLTGVAPPVFHDLNKNGKLDIILSNNSNILTVGHNGEILNHFTLNFSEADSLKILSGTVAISSNDNTFMAGNFSKNRLTFFDSGLDILPGYPVIMQNTSRVYPYFKAISDYVYVFLASDNGSIYRRKLSNISPEDLENTWLREYGNHQRTGSYDFAHPKPVERKKDIFIKEECYIYPNPSYGGMITLNIMPSSDTKVSVKIFDITARLLYEKTIVCQAYMNNRDKLNLNIDRMSPGIYFAVLEAEGKSMTIKFAIEK